MRARKCLPKNGPIIFNSYEDFRKAVAEEIAKQEADIYKRHAEQLIPQVYAMFFWTIELNYGWKKKRLLKLVENLKETDYLMDHPSRLHHRFDPIDCEREMKEKYGIDFRKEFPIRVEIQK